MTLKGRRRKDNAETYSPQNAEGETEGAPLRCMGKSAEAIERKEVARAPSRKRVRKRLKREGLDGKAPRFEGNWPQAWLKDEETNAKSFWLDTSTLRFRLNKRISEKADQKKAGAGEASGGRVRQTLKHYIS